MSKKVPAISAVVVATGDMSVTVTPNCSADTQPKGVSRNTIISQEKTDALGDSSTAWGHVWSAVLKLMQIPNSCQVRTSSSNMIIYCYCLISPSS